MMILQPWGKAINADELYYVNFLLREIHPNFYCVNFTSIK